MLLQLVCKVPYELFFLIPILIGGHLFFDIFVADVIHQEGIERFQWHHLDKWDMLVALDIALRPAK